MSRSAVIVSTARTPIGRAYRGAFNNLPAPTLGSHSVKAAVERAKIDGAEVDDLVFGAALQQGSTAGNIARQVALRAGLPITVSGMSLDRQCASGLMAIATAAKQIIVDRMDVMVAGGVESISLVQTPEMRLGSDPELLAMHKKRLRGYKEIGYAVVGEAPGLDTASQGRHHGRDVARR